MKKPQTSHKLHLKSNLFVTYSKMSQISRDLAVSDSLLALYGVLKAALIIQLCYNFVIN